ncbi:ArnT family glycosyltransferase [Dactylosporangium sp. CA-139114]|uniref:ArnT family glycosyltransferase n=1 Tax=Dactylosporangium sp. CA-139114 TaxID=3239931 RepID=UPI003D962BC0
MTALLEIERSAAVAAPAPPVQRRSYRSAWILVPLLVVAGLVNGWNLHGWPGRVNDDEGTYVDQAWAMLDHGALAHYTYWYDHPFLGWAIIAGYAGLTDGFDRAPSGVMVGREVMLIAALVSCALLWLLARRLRFNRAWSAVAVALFALSPLAVYFHRMVFLDNLATMFMLAALAAAASPRRSVGAALGSAVWFAGAALCKETIVILLPALVWLLVRHTDRRTRPWNLGVFGVAFVVLVSAYPVFALLKNELVPGDGHVSLSWALWWQLFGRSGSGSLLDPSSGAYSLAHSWVDLDPWLIVAGVLLVPVALLVPRLRPIALALLIQVAMMCRGGYLPFAYVIALLPFAALLIAGAGDELWAWLPSWRRYLPAGAAALVAVTLVLPAWASTMIAQSRTDGSADSRAATRWVVDHVPRDSVVVTDDYIWLDLKLAGFTKPVWLWKVDTDPEVMEEVLPAGVSSIDYIVMAGQADSTLASLPTLRAGVAGSDVVERFGEIEVRKVRR